MSKTNNGVNKLTPLFFEWGYNMKIIKFCAITILLFVIIIISLNFSSKGLSQSKITSYNKDLFEEDKLTTTLDKAYFLNQDPKHSSSAGITMPLPKMYDMYWNLEVINNYMPALKLEIEANKEKLLELLNQEYSNSTLPFLLKSFYITGIYNSMGYNGYQRVGYLNTKGTYELRDDTVAISSGVGSGKESDLYKGKPDLITLGIDMISLGLENNYVKASGSSYSAAIITGVVSLLAEKYDCNISLIESDLFSNTISLDQSSVLSQGGPITF